MRNIALSLLLIPCAFGQNMERVFRLTHTPGSTGQSEIATTLRTVADIRKLAIDKDAATITVEGPASQIALAEWMVPRLDGGLPGPQSYNVAGNVNDIVTVYPLAHVENNIELQQIITTFRTVLDVQKIYNISAPYTLSMRGTSAATAANGFLVQLLDHAVVKRDIARIDHLHIAGDRFGLDTLSVYGLPQANQLSQQEIIANLRLVADVVKIYVVTNTSDLAMRASQNEIQVAEWLIEHLDRQSPDSANTEMKIPGGKDDVIHVFYLPQQMKGAEINGLNLSVRTAANVSKSYWITTPPAIVARGTADAIAAVGKFLANATQGL